VAAANSGYTFEAVQCHVYGELRPGTDPLFRAWNHAHFSVRPAAKARAERDGLSPSAFTPDRLHRLVRLAVLDQKISLSRGAEVLRLGLPEMRALARDWSVVDR